MWVGRAAAWHDRAVGALRRALRRSFSRLMRLRAAKALARATLPPLERVATALSRGRVQFSSVLVPSLTLRTTGARSGLPRETALMCLPDGEDLVVVGSNFGDARHPAWTANLLAHPEPLVRFRGRVRRMSARLVTGDEREELWTRLEELWPGYRAYERDSGRELRIFRLSPAKRAGN